MQGKGGERCLINLCIYNKLKNFGFPAVGRRANYAILSYYEKLSTDNKASLLNGVCKEKDQPKKIAL